MNKLLKELNEVKNELEEIKKKELEKKKKFNKNSNIYYHKYQTFTNKDKDTMSKIEIEKIENIIHKRKIYYKKKKEEKEKEKEKIN